MYLQNACCALVADPLYSLLRFVMSVICPLSLSSPLAWELSVEKSLLYCDEREKNTLEITVNRMLTWTGR